MPSWPRGLLSNARALTPCTRSSPYNRSCIMAASLRSSHTTPVRRSPRILARLLAQPSLVSSGSLGTPQRKRTVQDPVVLQPSKRVRPDITFLETLAEAAHHLSLLHFNQSYCGEKALLVVTKKQLHNHPPTGYMSRIRLVLDNTGTYQLQVCCNNTTRYSLLYHSLIINI